MHIKSLLLEDFQSYDRATFDFDDHFNVIVGASNVGKSALSRALSFILCGTWDSSWVRDGAKHCRLTLVTDAGATVVREKGEKVNRYTLILPNATPQVYENFGTEIPMEIQQVLRIFKAQIDANEFLNLNIAGQMDSLFMLSKPGSFKAKVLGKLSGAHYLDYALRELNKDKKNVQTEKNLKEMEALDLQTQIAKFSGLDVERAKLDQVAGQMQRLADMHTKLEALKALFKRAQDWKARYTSEAAREEKFAALALPTAENLEALADRLRRIRDLKNRLFNNAALSTNAQGDLERHTKCVSNTKDKYIDLLQSAQTCPTCMTPVGTETLEKIKASL